MFDVFIDTHFSAGHHLRDYPGDCENPHGHNWKVRATIRATELDHLGMGIDFRAVKEAMSKIIDNLDHRNLNEHPDFVSTNPSSENIAVYIYNCLKKELTTERYAPHSVTVRETDNNGVTYYGESS